MTCYYSLQDLTGEDLQCSETKVRRCRYRVGERALEALRSSSGPVGLYFDGKKVAKAMKLGISTEEQITIIGYAQEEETYYGYSLPASNFSKTTETLRCLAAGDRSLESISKI